METRFKHLFYSGTSGLVLPIRRYEFPAPFVNASRITYYARLYNSLEVNSSFYKVPRPITVIKWSASVPDDFRFTFKMWRGITHSSKLNFTEDDVLAFMSRINQIGGKKGCLLIQFPSGIGDTYKAQLERLLGCIRESDSGDWQIAVEFRNASWYSDATMEMLEAFKATLVVHDMPGSATPKVDFSADFMYMRLHGPTGKYDGSYSDEVLREYAAIVYGWLSEGKEVYVYFNNTKGDALKNLDTFNGFIHSK